MMDDVSVLVTGGAGFIGSHLTRALVKMGANVRVLDNISRNVCHVQDLRARESIDFIKGDICDSDVVLEATKGVDYIFHQAAVCLRRCNAFPKEAIEVIIDGSHNIFYAAVHENVKKVIYASTSSVYGEPEYIPIDEKHPTNPSGPYGAAKLCVDHFAQFMARKSGLKFIALRYFNVYGRDQSTDAYYTSVINLFIKRVLSGVSPVIEGHGNQTLDFTYIDDVVDANIAAAESDIENEIFNVGYGAECSIKDLAEMILDLIGSKEKPIFLPREVPISRRVCDSKKMEEMLGVKCKTDLRTGISNLIDHVRKYPEVY